MSAAETRLIVGFTSSDVFAAVDFDTEMTIKSRRKFLAMAANEKMLTMSFHFDFPGLGYVKENEEAWVWESIKTSV